MTARRALVVCDNLLLATALQALIARDGLQDRVDLSCTPGAPVPVTMLPGMMRVDMRRDAARIVERYQLVISAHCKQLFPADVHGVVECINIHPGFNPDTRGWYPQVWAIAQGHRVGFTVHRIDDKLDHGMIVHRQEIHAEAWDTSGSLYHRIVEAEISWLNENLVALLAGNYTAIAPEGEGNLFLKKDFDALCRIDMEQVGTFAQFYDRMRALTFEGYRNAYFIDPGSGKKVFLELRVQQAD